jgi:hypothetical protein
MTAVRHAWQLFGAAMLVAVTSGAFAADDGVWTVGRSSGEVWLSGTGTQPASLKQEELLKPGDTVRTGRTGRVLLQRGDETILISPNSVVGIPASKTDGMATTIVQQAGSILLEVEKRNVKHFEVETPYLAAVVKGTQFRVTVGATTTSVDVVRGQVEVADFRTGQIAQVMPGQHATTFTQGKAGLALSGSGSFNPIEQGKPRAPSIEPVPVPKAGLSAPRNAANGPTLQKQTSTISARSGVTRITSSIGEVRLNFHSVTHGLARDNSSTSGSTRNAANKDTVWSSSSSVTTAAAMGNGQSSSGNVAAGSASSTSSASAASVSSVSAAVAAGSGSAGSGNSANGNANGKDNGNGNGNGNGKNNGNKGNGNNADNGNGNNGNGNGHGHNH